MIENENMPVDFSGTLSVLKQEAKDRKVSADDSEKARHWAIVYTELEKISAYVETYLSEESE
jgi:hypothetical protein